MCRGRSCVGAEPPTRYTRELKAPPPIRGRSHCFATPEENRCWARISTGALGDPVSLTGMERGSNLGFSSSHPATAPHNAIPALVSIHDIFKGCVCSVEGQLIL